MVYFSGVNRVGIFLLFVAITGSGAPAAEARGAKHFFEAKIRPLLSERCFECHSHKKQKGGLRLDSRAALLKGGDSGAAIVPGDAGASLLISAVRYQDADLQMPPKEKLGKRTVELLTQWVDQGAIWPGSEGAVALDAEKPFEITEEQRSYWAFQPVPKQAAACVDEIIDAALGAKQLAPNRRAERAVLIRRAFFDLTGLPPSYEEVQAFVSDPDPGAFMEMVDRLLAMPEYGERWGRHWLDVVRYAQSNGYERDDEKPESWRYREYVIDSFNADKPYDRFILEQLAGDELPDGGDAGLIATGFYRLGVHDDEPDDKRAAEFDALDDMLKTTTETFLGLTAGCARCHDHMFDPISQRDYYELLAFFRNIQKYPAGARDISGGKAMAVSEHGAEPMDTHVLVRGNAGRPAEKVEPRFPVILGGGAPTTRTVPSGASTGLRHGLARWIASPEHPLTARVMANRVWQYHFGRGIVATPNDFGKAGEPPTSIALLDWLAAEFVNSGWSVKHLHRVIMSSSAYQRSSETNRVNAAVDPGNLFLWRQNMRRLEAEAIRDAMLVASGALNLKRGGDRGFYPAVSGEVVAGASRPGRGWGWSSDIEQNRRSVYAFVKRTMVYPFFELFDYANTEGSLGARPTTTVAPQALLLLNGEFADRSAHLLEERVWHSGAPVDEAFRCALSRDPSERERTMAAQYLNKQEQYYVEQDDRMTFVPDYSPALFTEFHAALPADRYLRGPDSEAWEYFKGSWGDVYENIINNDRDRPPFALFEINAMDTALSGEVTLAQTTSRASFFLRANASGEKLSGYEFLINVVDSALSIRRHRADKIEILADRSAQIDVGQPVSFVVSASGSELNFRFGDYTLSAEDRLSIPSGRLGVSASGGPVVLGNATARADGVDHNLVRDDPARPARRAMRDFCALLFNLNEFVYID